MPLNNAKPANVKTSPEVSGPSTGRRVNDSLKEKVIQLRKQLERERYKCTYSQQQRDKIHTFWQMTKSELEEKKEELRNIDIEMKESAEKHKNEIRMYKQKVKQLLYPEKGSTAEHREVENKEVTMMPHSESLLKYNNPKLVSNKNTKKESPKTRPLKVSPQHPPAKPKRPSNDAAKQQTEKILNGILPPREWRKNDKLWVQEVSSAPCSRTDVIRLQEELDLKLHQAQAEDLAICPKRRELYTQCFDELIRQVTIICAERGVLLSRLRDEIRMTLAAHQTQYESSVAYGMRKALEAKCWMFEMENKLVELENWKKELETQLNEEKAICEATVTQGNEQRQVEEKNHAEEIQFLKDACQKMKAQLTAIIAPKN